MVLLGFSLLLSAHTARPTDILYIINFIRFPVNTAGSLILIRVSFFNFITVIIVAGVSTLSPPLLLIIDAVSSALPLFLADIMMIVCVCPVAFYT
jgi:hypothetical protein